ncbi:MAG: UvrB/UvrC motif-containing protein [Phycisphaerae bacterium]|nr:UvrB/UvrC motif-containing protein [Phycisphaerae bacterium]
MKRKCDRCENEATVHEVVIRNGEKAEKHLCESCAREEGFAGVAHAPISDLITKFVISQAKGERSPVKVGMCPSCGMTFAEFKQHGVLGCPECYTAFEAQLSSMIERAHEGATHHVGKTPKRLGGSAGRHERITALRKQLNEAITAEQYERAAALRDQLLHVEKPEAESESEPQRRSDAGGKTP